jgi:fatty-acyl-CoA synthase
VIVGAELAARLDEIRARLRGVACHVWGSAPQDMAPLAGEVAAQPSDALQLGARAHATLDDTALYIYTSGTTGMPKAAKVSHYRIMQWSHWFAGMLDTHAGDRMYNCLPLYHSVGGIVAAFATLVNGGSVVIRPRFSASDFWRDVRDERCTLFQYIGELCRYLVNTPPQPLETGHALRMACGNGLRPEVWSAFQTRFKIPHILEYYASTEGNFSLYNCEGEVGAIGRIPPFLASRLPVALLRFDVERGEPLRNADGWCERCATDETGEAVGLIPDSGAQRGGRFEGYADPEATRRKVLRGVFKPGDAWYRTGDLMRRDARGFYYFVDRVGETYRWKGENVSTAEVLSALTSSPGVLDGVVYGVQVPGTDGRAGTAALLVSEDFDPAAFRADIALRLPSYARPVFLRILTAIEATGTFKPRKQDLLAGGFDPALVKDPLYFDDARAQRYVAVDAELFAAIAAGTVRV